MELFDRFKNVVKSIAESVEVGLEQALQGRKSTRKNKRESEGSNKNQTASTSEKSNINFNKNEKMTMFNYGVGGNEVKVDANEAIQEIQGNKSLLVAKLTTDDAIAPEIVTGLKTVEEVFHYFTPSLEMEHETADGQSVKEVFRFNNLGDFTPKKMVENSPFLKGLKVDEEQYNKIVKQMQVNKVLRKVLEDQEAKREFADTLRAIAEELEK
ncbi:hypothetical protein [Myroides sp. DF42-4-2]|uniref:hypothetical protein n=1 Tax=unclassified Myroides TaxID=2642485 RepID=UPI0015F8BAAF|nr:hypothetical protein [Myroides sp. NP-2]MDM1406959.1 hypothetical protein [Myroides sp. DF42-4-2]